jgi:hypothetical protein
MILVAKRNKVIEFKFNYYLQSLKQSRIKVHDVNILFFFILQCTIDVSSNLLELIGIGEVNIVCTFMLAECSREIGICFGICRFFLYYIVMESANGG